VLPWLAWSVAIVFGLLSLLHVYWAFGGRRGANDVVPEKNGKPLFRPGTVASLTVAGLLAASALLVFERAIGIPGILPVTIRSLGMWGVATVLMARAVGEFNYIGIFKRRRESGFARRDNRIYTPLALGLAIGSAVIAWYGV